MGYFLKPNFMLLSIFLVFLISLSIKFGYKKNQIFFPNFIIF